MPAMVPPFFDVTDALSEGKKPKNPWEVTGEKKHWESWPVVTRGPPGGIHQGVSRFFTEEVDRSDCSEELIGNEALRLWALWKGSNMTQIVPSGLLQYDGLKECHVLKSAKRFLKWGRREDGERIAFSGRGESNVKRWRVFGKTKKKREFSNLSIALRDGWRQMKGREIRRAK